MRRPIILLLMLPLVCALIGYGFGVLHARPPAEGTSPAADAATQAAAEVAKGLTTTASAAEPSSAVPAAATPVNPDFVQTAQPQERTIPVEIPVAGKLSLDKQRLRIAASRVAGRLGRIFVFEGQSVKAGQPLAEIYSPDYLSAEREFLLATRFHETLAGDADAGLREDSEATAKAAGGRLRALGASDSDIERLRKSGTVEEYLQVRAPIAGVVIQRNVDPGAYLSIGDTLMSLADPGSLWLLADTYDGDYAALKVGESLIFTTPGLPGRHFFSRVSFISPSFDPATHTLAIRCDVPNPEGLLRPEMPVSGALTVGSQIAEVVPKQAVVHVRDIDYLVLHEGTAYRRLAVQGHLLGDAEYAVTSGIESNSAVVVDGGVLIDQTLGH